MFQPGAIQYGWAQLEPALPFNGGTSWGPALSGTFTSTPTETQPYHRSGDSPRLTMRAEFDSPCTVTVWRRPGISWQEYLTHTGQSFSALVKCFGGADLKLKVEGEATGAVDLIEP